MKTLEQRKKTSEALKIAWANGKYKNRNKRVVKPKIFIECEVSSCNKLTKNKKYCNSHAMRLWRYGDPLGGSKRYNHGMSNTPTYASWSSMKNRCSAENGHHYRYYVKKEIKVCERWQSFENFLSDMGEKPAGTTIDRIDNNKGYEPSNCRWVTWDVQCANRNNHKGEQIPEERKVRISNGLKKAWAEGRR